MPTAVPGRVGRRTLALVGGVGRAVLFLGAALGGVVRRPWRGRQILLHLHFIGNKSVSILLLTSAFTGMVLTLEGYTALTRFGSEKFIGPVVALGLIRELGPVLAALMVTARAGSAIAAVIANMRVSEQIDALKSLAVEPIQYLVSPRLVAALIAAPLLTAIFDLCGITAAYEFGIHILRLDGRSFLANVRESIAWADVGVGMSKSIVFAVCMAWLASFHGFHARGGADGVGRATTRAVVGVAAIVLAGDYVMTSLFF